MHEIVTRLSLRLMAALLLLLVPVAGLAAGPPPEAQAMAYLQEVWRSIGTPGISVAVLQRGRLVFSEGVGFADLDNMVPANGSTVYNVGSVSKAITAVAIMQLVEQGKVGLDEPIQKYVPTFPEKGSPITIRHIMTHTSGIRHYRSTDFPDSKDNENWKPYSSLEEAIKIFKDDPLLFKPGEYYFYSSYAANLLQGVVEKARGLAFEDYLRRYVWTPAGMLNTAFDIPERIVPHRAKGYYVVDGKMLNYPYGDLTYKFAGGGMISTAEDLVRLGAALNRGALLKPETVTLMYAPIAPVLQYREKEPPQATEFSQALIWRILKDQAGRTFVNHCGTVKGFNACLVNYPDQDLVVAILGNGYPTPARREAVAIAQFFLPL
ncbi:MAG TPA: serine hydrolase domain-containing protein [Thermoanaerobaculia bacterium]|nr:serine hydrolase domain-containing protein [Thermoanaerobaculia bacterium]